MWLLPLLIIGAVVVAAATKSSREIAPPLRQRQLPPPGVAGQLPSSGVTGASPAVPGPIAVLGWLLSRGEYPPPMVILCAIAEAEALGRGDLASDIVKTFVAPVVYQHQRERAGLPGSPLYERGSCALFQAPGRQAYERGSCSPRAQVPRTRDSCAPSTPGSSSSQPHPSMSSPPMPQTAVTPQVVARPPTEDEIFAMLHTDPKAFVDMVASQPQRRGPLVEIFPIGSPRPDTSVQMPASPVSTPPVAPPLSTPSEHLGQLAQMQEAAGLYEQADQTRASETMAQMQEAAGFYEPLGPGSPLPGVPDEAWRQFVAVLSRESPAFSSSRHVGQYRQRRERLAEVGIDPQTLHGAAAAQRQALDIDLADAYQHAAAGGLLAEHLGRPIAIPDSEGMAVITLSGVLGVIQCAGLEGAVGWLGHLNDRRRYPHTTQAFLRTNGVF